MQLENEKIRLQVRNSDLSGSSFEDVNLSACVFEDANLSGLKVSNANLTGMTIADVKLDGATLDGHLLTDLLAYWNAGHGAATDA